MFPFDLRYKHGKQKEKKMALTGKFWHCKLAPKKAWSLMGVFSSRLSTQEEHRWFPPPTDNNKRCRSISTTVWVLLGVWVCPMKKALFSRFFFSWQASSHLSFGCGQNTPKMWINGGEHTQDVNQWWGNRL